MKRKWSMRAYKEGDEEGILELWKAVYPEREYDREKWLRWWQWMYKDNPAGPGRIWLAEHDSKIVGQYAIVPVKVKIANKTILGSQSLDTMTHPDYRHQKIFETLAIKVYNEAEEDGIHIVYGFPGQFSYPGFIKKLNWFDVAAMKVMFKPLNWRNAIKLKIKNEFLQVVLAMGASWVFTKVFLGTRRPPFIESLNIKQVISFDDRINDLWAKISNQYHIMIVRDKDYLNWRYNAPGANYSIFIAEKVGEICGYLVLENKLQGGIKVSHIFDLTAQSEEIMRCLVSKSIDDCQQKKVDLIVYRLRANKTYQRILRRSGFISLPFLKGGRLCAYVSSEFTSFKESVRNSQNWLVQLGDSDEV
ncbi:MAG: GNAT family N-acetyltransferase [Dehalococcoidia bacterium]